MLLDALWEQNQHFRERPEQAVEPHTEARAYELQTQAARVDTRAVMLKGHLQACPYALLSVHIDAIHLGSSTECYLAGFYAVRPSISN
jgi:hypothetical protein